MLLKKEETDLKTFKTDDGLEIIIDTNTGESFASQRGYARIGNISETAVRKRLQKLANSNLVKKAEMNTGYGFKVANLLTEDLIAEWLPKDNPEMATAFMKLGIRMYMHTIAGFNKEEGLTKTDLQSFKQDLLNEIRSQCAPISRLDYSVKDGVARIVEAIKVLIKAQPTANKIYATIPAGYITYADFKSNNNYAFKRGAWSVVKNNMSPSKIIPKDGLNRIEYFDRQEVIDTINSLNTSKVINVQYGKTGNATIATVSVI